jgi:protein ImuB
MGVASYFPAEFGIAKGVDAQNPAPGFYAPGPYVNSEILIPTHPTMFGYAQKTLAVRYAGGPLLQAGPPAGFEQSLQLEHPVRELEPLSFILSRLLNQLCANLNEHALATNEVRLRLVTEQGSEYRLQPEISNDHKKTPAEAGTPNMSDVQERTITLPVPMRDPRTLLRLLLFDIEAHPPAAPITAVTITASPVKPRASQTGLFIPLAPEPEKLEITLARLAKLVGPQNVGSPELLDTHRPDAFRMKRFTVQVSRRRNRPHRQSVNGNRECVMGFRTFRPPWRAEVETSNGQPARINARAKSSGKVAGKVIRAAGPWRASGDWWRLDLWARDEWDIAVVDLNQESEIICRIYRDLTNEQWFVAGIYD